MEGLESGRGVPGSQVTKPTSPSFGRPRHAVCFDVTNSFKVRVARAYGFRLIVDYKRFLRAAVGYFGLFRGLGLNV